MVDKTVNAAETHTSFALEPDFPNRVGGSVGGRGPEERFPLLPANPVLVYRTIGCSVAARLAHTTEHTGAAGIGVRTPALTGGTRCR